MIVGATDNGKSWFCKQAFAALAKNTDAEFILYSPVDVHGWPKRAKIYSDVEKWIAAIEEFMRSGKRAAHVYCDEFAEVKAHFRSYERYPKSLQTLCSMGRHFGVTAWLCAQRPTMIHPNIRDNCKRKVVFKLNGARDARAMEDELPQKVYDGLPLSQAILQLPKLEAFMSYGMDFRKITLAKNAGKPRLTTP